MPAVQDIAIKGASSRGTLKVEKKHSLGGEEFFTISDEDGLIEIAMDDLELDRIFGRLGLTASYYMKR